MKHRFALVILLPYISAPKHIYKEKTLQIIYLSLALLLKVTLRLINRPASPVDNILSAANFFLFKTTLT